jgi:hypothetical protein
MSRVNSGFSIKDVGSRIGDAAQATVERSASAAVVKGGSDFATEGLRSVAGGVSEGLDSMGVPRGLADPVNALFDGLTDGASMMGDVLTSGLRNGYVPSAEDRLGNYDYYRYSGGQMVGYYGGGGDGSMGSIGASLGMFTADEAQLYNLIQDPLQKQMFLIDKRMKQQSLLCSMLTNIMSAKQDVLKEMGRNLRS